MLCCVIKGPTYQKAHQQLTEALPHCSIAELRLDLFDTIDSEQIKKLRRDFSIPMIFTLRSPSQGGEYVGSEEERINQIRKLSEFKPEYIDVESYVSPTFTTELKAKNPDTKIIVSFHDFEKMASPELVLKEMQKHHADIYKMAFMLHTSAEALSLLLFMKENAKNVLAMGMGPFGKPTRILGPVFGAQFVYANTDLESSTAAGQIPAKVLSDNYKDLNPSTFMYGLIGDPVSKSLSHVAHNLVLNRLNLQSAYTQFQVPANVLGDFLKIAKKSGIRGLSVTMPLKEAVIPFLDDIDPWAKRIGAVNTLIFENNRIKGYNADGVGAVDALEEKIKVKGKRIVFIGAGGAAKAVIAEAIDRGALVTILNRDEKRALALAELLHCKGGSLEQMSEAFHQGYDILVNTTPSPMPIDAQWILPETVVMDIKTQPQNTEFLKRAAEKKCTLVYGYEMFINQALVQFRHWFGEKIDLIKAKEIFQDTILKNIQKE